MTPAREGEERRSAARRRVVRVSWVEGEEGDVVEEERRAVEVFRSGVARAAEMVRGR